MNNYLQIPKKINRAVQDYLEAHNIKFEFIPEREEPDELPGVITFLGKEYGPGRYATIKLDTDADIVFSQIENAVKDHTL